MGAPEVRPERTWKREDSMGGSRGRGLRAGLTAGLTVGLTGGLGSGKSTVLRMFEDLGAYGLSADEIARALMEPGTPVFAAILDRFGRGVVTAGGRLDRPALAQIAFGNGQTAGRVQELNAIVHQLPLRGRGSLPRRSSRGTLALWWSSSRRWSSRRCMGQAGGSGSTGWCW